jgi:hypothetical protein
MSSPLLQRDDLPAHPPRIIAISRDGLSLHVNGQDWFLAFREFPGLLLGMVEDIHRVEQPMPDLLRWPALGIEIPVDFLQKPKNAPVGV